MKTNIEKVIELVKQGSHVKTALRQFNISSGYFYFRLTDSQREVLKSIRESRIPVIDIDDVNELFMAGQTVSSIARKYKTTISKINQIINIEFKVKLNKAPIWAENPITHYRNELINYMASTEGQNLPEYKLLDMAKELKQVNDYLSV